ncbi:CerR family C-terminal domain-containing protein [Uliginosibacterium sp. H3]|uniref:CerR family C-terminal domain-containing protein n=1 Tax=Uliginosibacterium silvisoli TaxID=3114758 RepID=A0ABU6JYP9_9RHOO|nr:CerR family C-terminal domain-containing protein [Uliginosibacterium sp. H3]
MPSSSKQTGKQPAQNAPANYAIGHETRSALLDAATEVFLEHGFRSARVQDIAERASIRLSAINYHFGGKEGLYLAVLQQHADAAIEHLPLTPPDPGLPLKERFAFVVRALAYRMLDTTSPSRIGPLLVREVVSPTAALDVMFERFTKPQAQVLMGIVSEILSADGKSAATSDVLLRAMLSVVGQCMMYRVGMPLIERLNPAFLQREQWLDEVVTHVVEFSWAGLQFMAKQRSKVAAAGSAPKAKRKAS